MPVEKVIAKSFSETQAGFPQVLHNSCGRESPMSIRRFQAFAHLHSAYYYY
jgi:hypothetical protein